MSSKCQVAQFVPGFAEIMYCIISEKNKSQSKSYLLLELALNITCVLSTLAHTGTKCQSPVFRMENRYYNVHPDQGSNLCLLHWQVDSLPLSHQGSPSSKVSKARKMSNTCLIKLTSIPLGPFGLMRIFSIFLLNSPY